MEFRQQWSERFESLPPSQTFQAVDRQRLAVQVAIRPTLASSQFTPRRCGGKSCWISVLPSTPTDRDRVRIPGTDRIPERSRQLISSTAT